MGGGTINAGGIIKGAFDIIADLITIVEFFTSTVDAEVHEIRDYTYNTRENLKKFMGEMGVEFRNYELGEIQNKWEKTTEVIGKAATESVKTKKYNDDLILESNVMLIEETTEAIEKANKITGKGITDASEKRIEANKEMVKLSWEEFKEVNDLANGTRMLNSRIAMEWGKNLDEKAKELYGKAADFLKMYPTIPMPLVERDTMPTDEGQAKAERDKISGEVKQVGDKLEELKTSAFGGGGVQGGVGGPLMGTVILASLERIENHLKAEQTGGGEPGEEETGEENIDGGGNQIVESITKRIDRLEEAQEKKLLKIEDNILFRITSLVDLIKKSSMTFKDIYDRLCKEMLYAWRNRSR